MPWHFVDVRSILPRGAPARYDAERPRVINSPAAAPAKGTTFYGNTNDGAYVCRKEAEGDGWHAAIDRLMDSWWESTRRLLIVAFAARQL